MPDPKPTAESLKVVPERTESKSKGLDLLRKEANEARKRLKTTGEGITERVRKVRKTLHENFRSEKQMIEDREREEAAEMKTIAQDALISATERIPSQPGVKMVQIGNMTEYVYSPETQDKRTEPDSLHLTIDYPKKGLSRVEMQRVITDSKVTKGRYADISNITVWEVKTEQPIVDMNGKITLPDKANISLKDAHSYHRVTTADYMEGKSGSETNPHDESPSMLQQHFEYAMAILPPPTPAAK